MTYKNASGGDIPNLGEADATNTDHTGQQFGFTFQHADVMFPILSIRQFATKDCTILFKRNGGIVKYPDGRRLPFTTRFVGFFVLLGTEPDTKAPSDQGFSRQG